MNNKYPHIRQMVAFLIMGSAALLLPSCKSKKTVPPPNPETIVTMFSEDLAMVVSSNGLKTYRFETPVMEQYDLAREPYTKYPKGVYVETFQDSTEVIESTLKADEAIYYQKRRLWMASGNVVATRFDGMTLYTEQLFWDEKTDRVYSNVLSHVVEDDAVHVVQGFESDIDFKEWTFRDYEGTIAVDDFMNERDEEYEDDGDMSDEDGAEEERDAGVDEVPVETEEEQSENGNASDLVERFVIRDRMETEPDMPDDIAIVSDENNNEVAE